MNKSPYNPRGVPQMLLTTSEAIPANRTNRFTKDLIRKLACDAENLLAILDPDPEQMAEMSGAMNTGCLLANELTNGQFFENNPELIRGVNNFPDYYLKQDGEFV